MRRARAGLQDPNRPLVRLVRPTETGEIKSERVVVGISEDVSEGLSEADLSSLDSSALILDVSPDEDLIPMDF